MKSRINPRTVFPQKIVGYCIETSKKNVLMSIAMELDINICFVGTESAGETVGYLARIIDFDQSLEQVENPPECEVMIISGLKNNVMNKLLKTLRENEIVIDLKCVVTSDNQSWRLCDLIEELKLEHKKMHGEK